MSIYLASELTKLVKMKRIERDMTEDTKSAA